MITIYIQTAKPKERSTLLNILLTFLCVVGVLALYVAFYVLFKSRALEVTVFTLIVIYFAVYFISKSSSATYRYELRARTLTAYRIVNKRTVKEIKFDLDKCTFLSENTKGERFYPNKRDFVTLKSNNKNYCLALDEKMMSYIAEKNVTDAFIEENREQMLNSLKELIAVPSVKSAPEDGKPFGKDCATALEKTLDLCSSLGMEVKNVDSYCGWAEIGSGDKMLGILCHLDVVPAGDGWDTDPFEAVFTDTEVFGRGAIDDKGPCVAAIYAVAAVKEANPDLPIRIRLIFGCDEESGWECMDKYLSSETLPDLAFTPDAEYPVITTEKGIAHFSINTSLKVDGDCRLYINGGLRANMVPDKASACIVGNTDRFFNKLNEFDARKNNIEFSLKGNKLSITAYGVGAHGSTPEKGQNALFNLFSMLEMLDIGGEQGKFVKDFNRLFNGKTDGSGVNLALSDEVSGNLTLNVGICNAGSQDSNSNFAENSTVQIVIDIRYPVTYSFGDISARLDASVPESWECLPEHSQDPLHMPEDSLLVQTLLNVYSAYTGKNGKPIAIGGGTYARALPGKAVAFGVQFPDREDKAHQPNESMSLDDFFISAKMFASAAMILSEKM